MNHKTIAIVVFVLYGLMSYGLSFTRPRKCSEHETPEQRYKVAVGAPFITIVTMAMMVGIVWAVMETFFQ